VFLCVQNIINKLIGEIIEGEPVYENMNPATRT